MTLHTAKGLEFPVVFLTGHGGRGVPAHALDGRSDELEEERRLAYVGITRAGSGCICRARNVRSAWGSPQYNPPSRFLDDIPAELVDWRRLPEPAMAAAAQRIAPLGSSAGRRQAGQDCGRSSRSTSAIASRIQPGGSAPSCPPAGSATRPALVSTSAPTWASRSCCCATPRWKSCRSGAPRAHYCDV